MTATFNFNEGADTVDTISDSASYYVVSGNSEYFKNKSTSYSSSGGYLIFNYTEEVKLDYGYGYAGATASITLKCTSAGKIS